MRRRGAVGEGYPPHVFVQLGLAAFSDILRDPVGHHLAEGLCAPDKPEYGAGLFRPNSLVDTSFCSLHRTRAATVPPVHALSPAGSGLCPHRSADSSRSKGKEEAVQRQPPMAVVCCTAGDLHEEIDLVSKASTSGEVGQRSV